MNVNYLASRALTPVYPIIRVTVFTFNGQQNIMGTVIPTYNPSFEVDANIQFSRPEKLKYIRGYNESLIYKDFWINQEQLTGLNRNISSGGDFLVFEALKYKVVEVDEKFRVGWTLLTCVQSDLSNE